MSNAAYIAYLQTVVAANDVAVNAKNATITALGQAISDAGAQINALTEQTSTLQADVQQLMASNVLLANLIAMLQSAK
jgi:hypothetical protein